MKYAEARNRIKTGDMILFPHQQGGGLRHMVERWFVTHGTASPYSHVGVAWSEHGRQWVMDITTKGCAPRLLSTIGSFDWAPAPHELSPKALEFAFSHFGQLEYSRAQAIEGELEILTIGDDLKSQCAEYALTIWMVDGMAPTNIATPAFCADGALSCWKSSITRVEAYQ